MLHDAEAGVAGGAGVGGGLLFVDEFAFFGGEAGVAGEVVDFGLAEELADGFELEVEGVAGVVVGMWFVGIDGGGEVGLAVGGIEVADGEGDEAGECAGAGGGDVAGEFEADDGFDEGLEGGAVLEVDGVDFEGGGGASGAAGVDAAEAGVREVLLAEFGVVGGAVGALAAGSGAAGVAEGGGGAAVGGVGVNDVVLRRTFTGRGAEVRRLGLGEELGV